MKERENSLGTHTSQRKKEKEKRNWDCVALHSQYAVRSTKKKTAEKERKGRERVLGLSAGKEGEDTACKAKQSLDWSWEGCLGLCPLDTVPRLTAPHY